ncbi:hypothetical protein SMGD1_1542 [Sulfurimonas gotlandica GD1]|jgi:hypothetical protein|uniref:Uncharacterized protein n=1 Tax=Sulfurimonas gotlandica (strain DSM 19862 / JCM 16533 / GD1) TaxID=929558 RepID=H1FTV2_SULGG|nr:hypothetical protein [Sulfurimonas gotlandica]EHP30066.1 hypothetical protein SMGD1_1542 [Sulfurimonas gotlandica GD1]
MSEDKKDLFKDYVPEVLEFDEEIDGSDEHKIREEHLSTKEDLLKKLMDKNSNKRSYRQPIRTENEK